MFHHDSTLPDEYCKAEGGKAAGCGARRESVAFECLSQSNTATKQQDKKTKMMKTLSSWFDVMCSKERDAPKTRNRKEKHSIKGPYANVTSPAFNMDSSNLITDLILNNTILQ